MNELIPNLDLLEILRNLATLAVAFFLALPIGWNRERSERNFGFRTFPLVAITAAAFMLVGLTRVETSDGFARLLAGLMTGVGFLGGGTIVKTGMTVRGLSTAAAIWATAALGAAVAAGRYEIAIVIAIVTYVVLTLLPKFGKQVDDHVDGDTYGEAGCDSETPRDEADEESGSEDSGAGDADDADANDK